GITIEMPYEALLNEKLELTSKIINHDLPSAFALPLGYLPNDFNNQ
ncbi:11005_t:CDS:1, partial [Ambispora leptoticha]